METKEEQLEKIELELKKQLGEFQGLKENAIAISSALDQRMSLNVELLLKEIKDVSLISVTAAPFSLTILLSGLNINPSLLAISFSVFMLNVLIMNIGVWYYNNEFLKSTSSQKAHNIFMEAYADDVKNDSLEIPKRTEALVSFFENEGKLKTIRTLEPYKYIGLVDKIRFIGIVFLSTAILFLISAVVLPAFI